MQLMDSFINSTKAAMKIYNNYASLPFHANIKRFLYRPQDRKQIPSMSWAKPLIEFNTKLNETKKENNPPAKLHIVYRIKSSSKRPWWEKRILRKFKLDEKCYDRVVVMNTPENNKLLKEIKHLVAILPLKIPQNLPDDDVLLKNMTLKSNGELVYTPRVDWGEPLTDKEMIKRFDAEFLKKHQRKLMELKLIHKDYFPATYDYPMHVSKRADEERKRQNDMLSWWQ